jgi:hypothetical protein
MSRAVFVTGRYGTLINSISLCDALATLVLLTFEKLQEVRVGAHPLGHGPRQLIVRHPLRQFHGEAWIVRCALVHECHFDSVVQILEVIDAGRQV